MTEYGFELTDSAGDKTFVVEGCTHCSMTTGGQHEYYCPLAKPECKHTKRTMDNMAERLGFYKKL